MVDEYEAYQPLIDSLRTHAQEVSSCTTLEEFISKCSVIEADIASIDENVQAYGSLTAAAEDALQKLDGLTGIFALT